MLNPVFFLLAMGTLAAFGSFAVAAIWYLDLRESRHGQHRMTRARAADPNRRDWAAITAERLTAPVVVVPVELEIVDAEIIFDPLDPHFSLAEVEQRMGWADDWYKPIIDFDTPVRELASA